MSVQLSPPPVESVRIGPHTVELDGSCILVRLHGPFRREHMDAWCLLADRVIAEHGCLYTISDFSTDGSIPAETRQRISHWPNVTYVRGAAIFGASAMVSVLFTMITRTTALLRKHTPPTLAAKTEREARAWVAWLQRQPAPDPE